MTARSTRWPTASSCSPSSASCLCDEDALPDALGASLVVTLISDNADLQGRLVRSPHVDRLNLGPIPTNQIGWDQPHEGNLFDHLYGRRAIQRVA